MPINGSILTATSRNARLYNRHLQPCFTHQHSQRIGSRSAHSSSNHYDTLGVPRDASLADIKKQFYSLSKEYHPDHNPNDPQASTRFLAISEAYATLTSELRRQSYDRDLFRSEGSSSYGRHPRGSHSSASTGPAGGRTASGLNRRRGQFRGPPPSFYRSGGWGNQSAKRSANTPNAESSHTTSSPLGGGFGPGQGRGPATDDDVPHFDRMQHWRTQETVAERARKRGFAAYEPEDAGGGSLIYSFIMVSGVVAFIVFVSGAFTQKATRKSGEDGI